MDDLIENSFAGLQISKKQRHASREAYRTSSQGEAADQNMTLHSNVSVTFHMRHLFLETFGEYLSNPIVLEQSLSPEANRDQIFKAGEGAGRSGSFFFFSHDRKFIIKTMSKGELDLLLKMLPAMSVHFKNNQDSLLAKILGAFTVKTDSADAIHLMLMENTLQLKNPDGLKYIFDLKGSLVDRKVTGKITKTTTMKDVNFLIGVDSNPNFVDLREADREKLLQIVKNDADFLADQDLMDYSLLVGIETLSDVFDDEPLH